eukprot:CAMPEP_0173380384 /NCGR_PEP_ID=MMETSP1356-20130122/3084_1 /TAXON_ID=77927 ORGANISM="Hemiselmis virescens, Strain PCC157" /NCGR_SAMPLE_ID=MMETSP1356 /ASSEMBLY_ACC=CAM_ASM_000847 /LENGTH=71 /DNA_ID=CAMNT_0014333955 /DNA_START=20 /DNA_END=235 /DNA_ORIENTATION=+
MTHHAAAAKPLLTKKAVPHQPSMGTRILEACAVKMFRSSLGPNDSDAKLCMKKYDHAKVAKQAAFIKAFGV